MSESLFEWQTPTQMKHLVEELRRKLGHRAMLNEGSRFREAYLASEFSIFRGASAVSLLKEAETKPTPDFRIMLDGVEKWFESTECDRPFRRRMDEYRNGMPPSGAINEDEWVSPEAYLKVVNERVNAKSSKGYERCDGLLIYSNAWIDAPGLTMPLDWWQDATRAAQHSFNETWLLKGNFIRLF